MGLGLVLLGFPRFSIALCVGAIVLQFRVEVHLGQLHVVLVHFPIALAIAAGAADLLWLVTRRPTFREAGLYCLIAALATALPTAYTGLLKAEAEEQAIGPTWANADLAEQHEHMAFAALGVMFGAAVARVVWMKVRRRWVLLIYGLAMVALLVLISLTGDLGGQIVYGRGFLKNVFH